MQNKKNILISIFCSIVLTACGGGGGGGGSTQSTPTSTSSTFTAPASNGTSTNYFQYAWHTNENIDATYKTNYTIHNNAHIKITNAWTTTKGKYTVGANINQAVKVAVIDEDFDLTHPDINGKVINAYNVMDNTTNVSNTNKSSFSHGTAVAGAIASSENGNDNLGIAPEVELILINIDLAESSSDTSTTTDLQLAAAFAKADELGAKVINCSWGGSALKSNALAEITRLKNKGITIIFASGNGDSSSSNAIDHDSKSYTDPSELDTVIGVGATSKDNEVTTYSNYGSKIDLLAPGGNSTLGIPLIDEVGTAGSNNSLGLVNNYYTFASGTSFATPITSGVVALMYAVNPNLTFDDVRRILISTTDKIGTGANYQNVTEYSTTLTFDSLRAFGKINASAAVNQASTEYVP